MTLNYFGDSVIESGIRYCSNSSCQRQRSDICGYSKPCWIPKMVWFGKDHWGSGIENRNTYEPKLSRDFVSLSGLIERT